MNTTPAPTSRDVAYLRAYPDHLKKFNAHFGDGIGEMNNSKNGTG